MSSKVGHYMDSNFFTKFRNYLRNFKFFVFEPQPLHHILACSSISLKSIFIDIVKDRHIYAPQKKLTESNIKDVNLNGV